MAERPTTPLDRRLRLSGLLIALGLAVEVVTMQWSHPATFLIFAGLGGGLVIAGILIYLRSLVA